MAGEAASSRRRGARSQDAARRPSPGPPRATDHIGAVGPSAPRTAGPAPHAGGGAVASSAPPARHARHRATARPRAAPAPEIRADGARDAARKDQAAGRRGGRGPRGRLRRHDRSASDTGKAMDGGGRRPHRHQRAPQRDRERERQRDHQIACRAAAGAGARGDGRDHRRKGHYRGLEGHIHRASTRPSLAVSLPFSCRRQAQRLRSGWRVSRALHQLLRRSSR
jgi:hypothetical protein